VYDILGRRVRKLLNEVRDAGTYEIEWNGRDDSGIPVSSGLYLYRFSSEGTNIIKKMMLVK
jgi:flagellar hook assembly protein FlgD